MLYKKKLNAKYISDVIPALYYNIILSNIILCDTDRYATIVNQF